MSSSNKQIGYENQKILLAILLIDVWQDIDWSYEGKGQNEADFQIGNNIYESKTFVDGEGKYIQDSKPPKEIKKAVFQLFKNTFGKNKFIITNKKIFLKNSKIALEDATYDFFEIFQKGKVNYKKKSKEITFTEEDLEEIKIIVKGVSKGSDTKEILKKAIDTFRAYIAKNKEELTIDSERPYKLALSTFLTSISSQFRKIRKKNPLRHHLFYSLTELDFNWWEDEDFEKLEKGVEIIISQKFLSQRDEEIKHDLIKLNYSKSEIDELFQRYKRIKKWREILK